MNPAGTAFNVGVWVGSCALRKTGVSAVGQPGYFRGDASTEGESFEEAFSDVLRSADTVHELGLGETGDAEGG